ncbi:MAG: YihY/virulence factor BrkB family protein [Chthoniobacteraceae bacterium]
MWAVIWRTGVKYVETDGEQRAAAFAYYALFSLLPLLVLLITLSTRFVGDREQAISRIFDLLSQYIVVDLEQVRGTVQGFMRSRLGSGLISFGILTWTSLRFFHSLVRAVNSAWGTHEYSWWRLPLKNLLMVSVLASALLIGLLAPAILNGFEKYYIEHHHEFSDFGLAGWAVRTARSLLPPLLLFYSLALFYKFAPQRKTTFREVWIEALLVTAALGGLQKLFVFYTSRIANFNVLYGTFGSVVALLLWIYLTGTLIIAGGCACSARAEISRGLSDQAASETL